MNKESGTKAKAAFNKFCEELGEGSRFEIVGLIITNMEGVYDLVLFEDEVAKDLKNKLSQNK